MESINMTYAWWGFSVFILVMLTVDLFYRKSGRVNLREAVIWTIIWIVLAMGFNLLVYYFAGSEKAMEFFAGYLIEKSLSVDNIFVIILIFGYFKVPDEYQHRVLFWGILGALIMRIVFIFAGVELIHSFHWLIYLFGAFLIITAYKIFRSENSQINPGNNPVVKFVKRFVPITSGYEGGAIFTWQNGKLWATPLFLVMVTIETTDLIFAVDSIPAILAVTDDAFIVYSSNVFAILGLRSLYFILADAEKYFANLKYGLAAILLFVGVKMCLTDVVKVPVELSLMIIAFVLIISLLSSKLQVTRKAE